MRTGATITSAIAAMTLAACQVVSDPPAERVVQDVEFLRGCWVAKGGPDGPYLGFLRLLPEGADGLTYQGYLHDVTDQTMKARLHLSFMRDGSSMTTEGLSRTGEFKTELYRAHPAHWLTPRPGRTTYTSGPGTWLIVDGEADALIVKTATEDGHGNVLLSVLFNGERDGCD